MIASLRLRNKKNGPRKGPVFINIPPVLALEQLQHLLGSGVGLR